MKKTIISLSFLINIFILVPFSQFGQLYADSNIINDNKNNIIDLNDLSSFLKSVDENKRYRYHHHYDEHDLSLLLDEQKWDLIKKKINFFPENKKNKELLKKIIKVEELLDSKQKTSAEEIFNFLKINPKWPYKKALRIRMENLMDIDKDPKLSNKIFNIYSPISIKGKEKYFYLYEKKLLEVKLKNLIIDIWKNGGFVKDFNKINNKYKKYLTEKINQKRIENLLWQKKTSLAKENFRFVQNKQMIKIYKAEIAIIKKQSNAKKLFKQINYKNYTASLVYHYLEYHKNDPLTSKEINRLIKGHLNIPLNRKVRNLQSYMTRELLEKKKYQEAYNVISNHISFNHKGDISSGEFLSGWIALRFLNKPQVAIKHFKKFNNIVKTTISKSRGQYWLARALLALGGVENINQANLIFKKNFENYPYNFYGQLSGEKLQHAQLILHDADNLDDKDDKKSISQNINKAKQSLDFNIAILSSKYHLHKIFTSYITPIIEKVKDKHDLLNISNHFNDNHPHHNLWIAKIGLQKDIPLKGKLFPVPFRIKNHKSELSLIYSIIKQESVFQANAVSHANAYGLMQLLPSTAKMVAKKHKIKYDKLALTRNPYYNIKLGDLYINDLIERYDGSYILAIASYNAGYFNIDKWIQRFGDPRKMNNIDNIIDWIELIPFKETRNYVQRVIENMQVYRAIFTKNNNLQIAKDLLK